MIQTAGKETFLGHYPELSSAVQSSTQRLIICLSQTSRDKRRSARLYLN